MLYIIAFWHLSGYSEFFYVPFGEFLKNASLGLFMYVSGYLLGGKYIITTPLEAWTFIKNRFLRIYPLYVISLLLFWFHSAISTRTLICSLFGVSSFFPPQPPTLWFVSMLFVFYTFFIIISGSFFKYKIILSTIFYMALLVLCSYYKTIDHRILYYSPCFFIGVISSERSSNYWGKCRGFISSLSVFILCVGILYYKIEIGFIPCCFLRGLISLSGAYIILFIANQLNRIPNIEKVFRPLSYASMAAYMFHRQIISIIRYMYWPAPSIGRVLYLYLICVPIVLVAGYLIQFSYDKSIKQLR